MREFLCGTIVGAGQREVYAVTGLLNAALYADYLLTGEEVVNLYYDFGTSDMAFIDLLGSTW